MAQIDQTRPDKPVPGIADEIVRHTLKYNDQFHHGVDENAIRDMETDTIYECCPFSDLISSRPEYGDWDGLRRWMARLTNEMDTKGKNEWAKNILNHINDKNEVKATPFWRTK